MPSRKPSFESVLARHGLPALERGPLTTLQVNVGKVCNQACHHCHVDAGPKRTESMGESTAGRALELLARSPGVQTVDITGGAPELNPSFRRLVIESRRMGRQVIDRCNLTVLLEPGQEDLGSFLAEQEVKIVASLPCYLEDNVDRQRGGGVFEKSIAALKRLNTLGYGQPGPSLSLDLVYNPQGPSLPPAQAGLEEQYKDQLRSRFGIEFGRLLTITNMPIQRFAQALSREGKVAAYDELLRENFNPATVDGLMCRSLISVGWDGRLFDCDFNQMLEVPVAGSAAKHPRTIWEIESFGDLEFLPIATGSHCFGCTAGAGSSCTGALDTGSQNGARRVA